MPKSNDKGRTKKRAGMVLHGAQAILAVIRDEFRDAKLTIEVVPASTWELNARAVLRSTDWDRVRRAVYEKAGNRCEVCGGRGTRHAVDCHEVWHFDDKKRVQTLVRCCALCPACHEVKHIGLAMKRGRGDEAKAHLARVNNWDMARCESYIHYIRELWAIRSSQEWTVDLSWLREQGLTIIQQATVPLRVDAMTHSLISPTE